MLCPKDSLAYNFINQGKVGRWKRTSLTFLNREMSCFQHQLLLPQVE